MISLVLELITDWFHFFQMPSGMGWIVTIAARKCLILLLLFTKLIFFSELVYKKVKITDGYFRFTTQKVQTGAGAT